MLRASVKRDQFSVSPYGIVHMPTDAAFTPNSSNPNSGTLRVGHLSSRPPNDGGFKPDDVCRFMDELWVEYVANHPELSEAALPKQHKRGSSDQDNHPDQPEPKV
jgi:hypothetical protein